MIRLPHLPEQPTRKARTFAIRTKLVSHFERLFDGYDLKNTWHDPKSVGGDVDATQWHFHYWRPATENWSFYIQNPTHWSDGSMDCDPGGSMGSCESYEENRWWVSVIQEAIRSSVGWWWCFFLLTHVFGFVICLELFVLACKSGVACFNVELCVLINFAQLRTFLSSQ